MEIRMNVRSATMYTVPLPDNSEYETFDYDKAERMLTLTQAGFYATECTGCKAVIPIALVDLPGGQTMEVPGSRIANACPASTSLHMIGHHVTREDYQAHQDRFHEGSDEGSETPWRICATCDKRVPDDDSHPSEWMCSNPECGIWFHVGGDDRCPECGAPGLE